MELCIFTEPQQGASYDDLLAAARATQEGGFHGFFRSDHYEAMWGDGLPGPSDAWTSLAGLARETSGIRLGTLVSPVTFRLPGPLAIQVAQVDQMSGGRVDLGLGAGWFDHEHAAYGIAFPSVAERFDRFEEQLQIIPGLWSTPLGKRYSFDGAHYTLSDSPALPKPVQELVPVIIGGGGKQRTPQLAATYASEFNAGFCTVEAAAERFGRVRAECVRQGRDPATLRLSFAGTTAVGAHHTQVAERAAVVGADVAELRRTGIAGSAAEAVDRIGAYAEIGVSRMYLQLPDLRDLALVEFLAAEVAPQLL